MPTILANVTVEKTAGGRFIARTDLKPEAEADSPEEAVAALRATAPLEPIRANDHPNPWVALAGAFKGDPLMAEWRQAMADRRAELAAQELGLS